MKWIRLVYRNKRRKILLLLAGLLLSTHPVVAKLAVDFNPNLDFSKFKTFAFIGGVEGLFPLQVISDPLHNKIAQDLNPQLAAKRHVEAKPRQNPELMRRECVTTRHT